MYRHLSEDLDLVETGHWMDWDQKTEEEKEQVEEDAKRLLKLHMETEWFDNWVKQYNIDRAEQTGWSPMVAGGTVAGLGPGGSIGGLGEVQGAGDEIFYNVERYWFDRKKEKSKFL